MIKRRKRSIEERDVLFLTTFDLVKKGSSAFAIILLCIYRLVKFCELL